MKSLLLLGLVCLASCSVPADEVLSLPGLDHLTSRLHSGYIQAKAANQTFFTHYLLTAARSEPDNAPLVLWQQGGPGSSGMAFGWLAELGPYTVNAASLNSTGDQPPTVFHNPNSFDQAANVLILEHPPGTGFSYCTDESGAVVPCVWNDQTQAEAFEASLNAFYASWPQYNSRELYMIGESYAGLLLPFLVDRLIDSPSSTPARQLRALAIGNGCPGTSGSTPDRRGTCNGPYGDYDTEHVFELVAGHGGISDQLHDKVVAACGFPCHAPTWSEDCNSFNSSCHEALAEVNAETGPFDIYNYYDNCGTGNSDEMSWAQHMAAGALPNPSVAQPIRRTFSKPTSGGESYQCGTGMAAVAWANRADVREALHMKPQSFYGHPWSTQAGPGMSYTTYTGSSFDLYPKILQHTRVTIYNGDVDACVPYNSNEAWVSTLAAQQHLPVVQQWRPWISQLVPAGYVTTYGVAGRHNFTFVTIKDSGHMVPQYQPERALEFFRRWLQGGDY